MPEPAVIEVVSRSPLVRGWIVQLRAAQSLLPAVAREAGTSGDQYLSVAQERRGMELPSSLHRLDHSPLLTGRIKDLSGRDGTTRRVGASRDENGTIPQQCRSMVKARATRTSSSAPGVCCWIEDFRAVRSQP